MIAGSPQESDPHLYEVVTHTHTPRSVGGSAGSSSELHWPPLRATKQRSAIVQADFSPVEGEDEILVYLGGMGVVLLGGNIGLCGGRGGGG